MSVARSYARALFEAASQSGTAQDRERLVSEAQSQMSQMLQAVLSSKQLEAALTGPLTTRREKVGLIHAIAEKAAFNPMMGGFFYLLARKGRFGLLARIQDEFAAIHLAAQGGIRGKLVSAEPMTHEDIEELGRAFTRKFAKPVAFQVSMDPTLLAGVKVVVNGVTYDGSLRAQLNQLRNRVAGGAAVH